MYPLQVIVVLLQETYEHSRSFLTIRSSEKQPDMVVTFSDYVRQFWTSRRKNKATAQRLVSVDDLARIAQKTFPDVPLNGITSVVKEMIGMGALCGVRVDVGGSAVQKLLVTPLGFGLWRNLDRGPLFNQQQVSLQEIDQLLTRDLLTDVLKQEAEVWLCIHQNRLGLEPTGPFTPEMISFGMYLLLNGAIAEDHALHLVRTSNKNYKWDETLVQGLNIVAEKLFGDDCLFKVPSLQDVLQRRSELTTNVGPTFVWYKAPPGDPREYYWWKIGDYQKDPSALDHVIGTLIHRVLERDDSQQEMPSVDERFETLVQYFRYRVKNSLPRSQMSDLFPAQPNADFDYALRESFARVSQSLSLESVS